MPDFTQPDFKQKVIDILEATAPEAARRLQDAVKYGENLKKDQAYEAALEVLDRVGIGKKSETTINHNQLPSLPNKVIASALTYMAKMFNAESEMQLAANTITTSYTEITDPDQSGTSNQTSTQSSDQSSNSTPVTIDDDDDQNIQFSIAPGLKGNHEEN